MHSFLCSAFAALTLCFCTGRGNAQIVPAQEFYGVGRPMPMVVQVPPSPEGDSSASAGDRVQPSSRAEIVLLSATADEPLASAAVIAGRVDLAALLPSLWSEKRREVLFAQLRIGGRGVGPAVVLAPMVNQLRARSKPVPNSARPLISFEALEGEEDVYSGIQAWVDQRVIFETDAGMIEIATRPDAAPLSSSNFLRLARGGFYQGTGFHRVVPLTADGHGFVIQGGDPTGTGSGGCGYYTDLENSRLPHDLGVVSLARASDPDSNGSQFFICLSRAGTARLDGAYNAFAVVTRGIDTVRQIARTPLQPGSDKPLRPPLIESVKVVDAPPMEPGRRPQPPVPDDEAKNPVR